MPRNRLLLGVLGIVVIVGAVIGGAAYLGVISVGGPLRAVGLGSAYVEVDDLRDQPISAQLAQYTNDEDNSGDVQTVGLASFDVRTLATPGSGRYHLTLMGADGNPFDTCTMTVRSGDHYRIVVLADTVAVRRDGPTPSAGTELTTGVSSLCLGV